MLPSEMKKMKRIKVNVGTDIMICAPSHPLLMATKVKRIIDKALTLPDIEHEYNCNSMEGIAMFEHYGAKAHPNEISVWYFINGRRVKYQDAMNDLARGKEYVKLITGQEI